MRNLCLSGFLLGNVYGLLNLKHGFKDYMSYDSYEEFKKDVTGEYEIAVGYSLGGRILLRLISENAIKVKRLYLVSAPYYVHKRPDFPYGMPKNIFNRYGKIIDFLNPTLVNLLLKGLFKIKLLPNDEWTHAKIKYWFNFLAEDFELKPENFPTTKIFQGDNDMLVHYENGIYIKKTLEADLEILNGKGHVFNPKIIRDQII